MKTQGDQEETHTHTVKAFNKAAAITLTRQKKSISNQ